MATTNKEVPLASTKYGSFADWQRPPEPAWMDAPAIPDRWHAIRAEEQRQEAIKLAALCAAESVPAIPDHWGYGARWAVRNAMRKILARRAAAWADREPTNTDWYYDHLSEEVAEFEMISVGDT